MIPEEEEVSGEGGGYISAWEALDIVLKRGVAKGEFPPDIRVTDLSDGEDGQFRAYLSNGVTLVFTPIGDVKTINAPTSGAKQ